MQLNSLDTVKRFDLDSCLNLTPWRRHRLPTMPVNSDPQRPTAHALPGDLPCHLTSTASWMARVLGPRRPQPRLQGQAQPGSPGGLARCPGTVSTAARGRGLGWVPPRRPATSGDAQCRRVLRAGDDRVLRELTGGPQELSVALTQCRGQGRVMSPLSGVGTGRGD